MGTEDRRRGPKLRMVGGALRAYFFVCSKGLSSQATHYIPCKYKGWKDIVINNHQSERDRVSI